MIIKKLFLALLFTIYYLLFTIAPASAAGLSLGIYPPILQIEAEPPANIKAPITIQNQGDETVNLQILFKPFTASEKENGEVVYLGEKEVLKSAYPFIWRKIQVFDNDHKIDSLTLAPQQQKTLDLHIGIPQDEPLSDYYFSIIFVSKPDVSYQSNISQTSGGIATNVLLTIGPKGKASGVIEEFSTPRFLEKGPVPFTVRVKNTSQYVIAPQGQILIKNMFGQTIGKVELSPVNILANTIRVIPDSLQSPDATPSATINPSTSLRASNQQLTINNLQLAFNSPKALWRESFLLGAYTATLTIALTNEGPLFSRRLQFYAVPTQAVIGLIVAILIILIVRNKVVKKLS